MTLLASNVTQDTENTPSCAGHSTGKQGSTRQGGAFTHEAAMKQDQFFEPPGHHQPMACSYREIIQQAGELNAEFTRNEQMNVRRALEIGCLLNRARPLANNDWEQTLEEFGISHQRASDFMWGAKQDQLIQERWQSITDLRKHRDDANKLQNLCDTARLGRVAPPVSVNPAAGMAPPPPKPGKLCASCQRRGHQIGCDECKRLNGARIPKAPPTEEEPRQPGADDGEIDAAADKYEEDQLKKVFKSWFGEVKKIAKTYGLRWGNKISESDPRFQRAFSLHCKARDALRDLLRELSLQHKTQGIPE